MNNAELKKLLKTGEWNDVEFKKARTAVPKSAFETVSAFANTHGGWLIFGVAQQGEEFTISGVEKPDKVQNDFLSVLHAGQKVNHDQDYGDHSRKAVIKFYRDGIQFWNPGDVFGDDSRLMEPGEKEVRNPGIAAAMRRIAMCEQAGTGMRMMREEWQKLGHPAPTYKNDRAWKAFEFFIPELDKEVDMASDLMKAMFGEISQATDQAEAHDEAHEPMSNIERRILKACLDESKSTPDLLHVLGYKTRTGNFKRALARLLVLGCLERTIPDMPRSKNQRYRLTKKGYQFLAKNEVGGE